VQNLDICYTQRIQCCITLQSLAIGGLYVNRDGADCTSFCEKVLPSAVDSLSGLQTLELRECTQAMTYHLAGMINLKNVKCLRYPPPSPTWPA